MKLHLRGFLKTIDKYNKAHLAYLSQYDYYDKDYPDSANDYTKECLMNYDKKFKKEFREQKIPQDVDEMLLKTPLCNYEFIIQFTNKTKYLNKQSQYISCDNLIHKRILCTVTIVPYTFYKTTNKPNKILKQQIKGWKIICKQIRLIV